jgi:hypothetical protein
MAAEIKQQTFNSKPMYQTTKLMQLKQETTLHLSVDLAVREGLVTESGSRVCGKV